MWLRTQVTGNWRWALTEITTHCTAPCTMHARIGSRTLTHAHLVRTSTIGFLVKGDLLSGCTMCCVCMLYVMFSDMIHQVSATGFTVSCDTAGVLSCTGSVHKCTTLVLATVVTLPVWSLFIVVQRSGTVLSQPYESR